MIVCIEYRSETPAEKVDLWHITDRQKDIIILLSEDLRMKQIADRLGISTRTVEDHMGRIYAKLGILPNRTGKITSVIRWAAKVELLCL